MFFFLINFDIDTLNVEHFFSFSFRAYDFFRLKRHSNIEINGLSLFNELFVNRKHTNFHSGYFDFYFPLIDISAHCFHICVVNHHFYVSSTTTFIVKFNT